MSELIKRTPPSIDFETPTLLRHRRFRYLKDRLAGVSIGMGGISVIVAIMLIFIYLVYEIAPMFVPADMQQSASIIPAPSNGETRYLATEEQGEIGLRVTSLGEAIFFATADGRVHLQQRLPIPGDVTVTKVAETGPGSDVLIAALSDGSALVFRHRYALTYPDDQRVITPSLVFPYGEAPIPVDAQGEPLQHIAFRSSDDELLIVAATRAGRLVGVRFEKNVNMMTDEVELEAVDLVLPAIGRNAVSLLLTPDSRWLFVAEAPGVIEAYDWRNKTSPELTTREVMPRQAKITTMQLLLGGKSLLVGDSLGYSSQWFMVRDENNAYELKRIRDFEKANAPVESLVAEHRRKGFVAATADGHVAFFNSTANRKVLERAVSDQPLKRVTIGPRGNVLLVETATGEVQVWQVHNEHPEVSLSALWQQVWYEGYEAPDYVWQSSASNNDFEPKYSLAPLAFGTLKAAFYAMILATPLAICGAIYTAYFMAPALRRKVKPAIELMEALPTVILGFLAGLFFAPFMEQHMPGVFTILLVMPLSLIAFGFMWANLPAKVRQCLPDGWAPVLLIPVVLAAGWLSFAISPGLEHVFFGGDIRLWLTQTMGIGYDQRNALVVGVAMGFAVIPTIFSITEDAIFGVPKHLSFGSLALGATPWQTLVRVILPTASPGIFSALMIGMGRAVGETMIVLMATGNTPIMDVNIFEGMRTLSANIAVEMPESEVGSTHYRILFLAAFVLFVFTFVVNTAAEFVRQRLRARYNVI